MMVQLKLILFNIILSIFFLDYIMDIKLLIIFIIVFVGLDLLWINYFANFIGPLIEKVQNEKMKIDYMGASLAYIIMLIAYWYIAFDDNYKPDYYKSAILGLAIYGTYEFTNYATINKWKDLQVLSMDIGWGIFISVVSLYLTTQINSFI